MPDFTAVPDVPTVGLQPWEFNLLSAIKANMDLLTGASTSSRAVTNDSISVSDATMQLTQVTAQGAGISVSGGTAAEYNDYVKLYYNVITLANDLYNTQQILNTLIQQLSK